MPQFPLPLVKTLRSGLVLAGLTIFILLPQNTIILPALAASDYSIIALYFLAEQLFLVILRALHRKGKFVIFFLTPLILIFRALLPPTPLGLLVSQALLSTSFILLSSELSSQKQPINPISDASVFPFSEAAVFISFVGLSVFLAVNGGTLIHALFGLESRDHLGLYAYFLMLRMGFGLGQSIILHVTQQDEVKIHIQPSSNDFGLEDKRTGIGEEGKTWFLVDLNICFLGVGIATFLAFWVLQMIGAVSMAIGLALGEKWLA